MSEPSPEDPWEDPFAGQPSFLDEFQDVLKDCNPAIVRVVKLRQQRIERYRMMVQQAVEERKRLCALRENPRFPPGSRAWGSIQRSVASQEKHILDLVHIVARVEKETLVGMGVLGRTGAPAERPVDPVDDPRAIARANTSWQPRTLPAPPQPEVDEMTRTLMAREAARREAIGS